MDLRKMVLVVFWIELAEVSGSSVSARLALQVFTRELVRYGGRWLLKTMYSYPIQGYIEPLEKTQN
jgi:hypothetical protein